MRILRGLWLALALWLLPAGAFGEYDAHMAEQWLEGFAAQIAPIAAKNDVQGTADPARAGEYLLEYDFGTVMARRAQEVAAGDILRVEITAPGAADCRGLCVGQTLEDVIGGREIPMSDTPLYVLGTQDAGYGWSWAYISEGEVYGVEFISYAEDAEMEMKEYTLTYVINDGSIAASRLQIAQATLAQAQEGLNTAEEIAGRQLGEILVMENAQPAFSAQDMTLEGERVLGAAVEELVAIAGEPKEIQTLSDAMGRLLVYDALAVQLAFDEMTGVERVCSLSCASALFAGPRGLRVGMSVQEAASLWRCDGDVFSVGGALYLAGEAQDVAPYGALSRGGMGAYTLTYACLTEEMQTGVLEIGTEDGTVTHWRLYIQEETAAYGA